MISVYFPFCILSAILQIDLMIGGLYLLVLSKLLCSAVADMCVKVQLDSVSEASTRRHYSEVAEKIGHLIRNDLIGREKKLRRPSFKINFLAQSLNSLSEPAPTPQKSNPNFQIHLKKNLPKQKNLAISEFKQKLKQNLNESRLKKQQAIEQLTNKIRWRKTTRQQNKNSVMEEHSNRKKYQAGVVKGILERSREYLRVLRRQGELQHAFGVFERRIRGVEQGRKTGN